MGAISRPEFVTCLWPEATRLNKSEGTAHGDIVCQKIGTGCDFIPKREIKKKCAAIFRIFLFVVVRVTCPTHKPFLTKAEHSIDKKRGHVTGCEDFYCISINK